MDWGSFSQLLSESVKPAYWTGTGAWDCSKKYVVCSRMGSKDNWLIELPCFALVSSPYSIWECFQHFFTLSPPFWGLFCYSHAASTTFSVFYYCCKRAFPLLAGQQSSRDLERWRERRREKWESGGAVWRWTVALPRGLLLPRRHRGRFVSVFVLVVPCVLAGSRGPVCHITDLLLRLCCQG